LATNEASDPRLAASRYTVGRLSGEEAPDEAPSPEAPNAEQRAAIVETTIQQAMRRGEFDNLPGAGKPLHNLTATHDPDWWLRRKIERERLTGLGPPALALRVESASLEERLDALHSEAEVRDLLEDFNHRVTEARRQLLGGPPVVTPLREIDAEVEAWRLRRAERLRALEEARAAEDARRAAMSRRERRRYDRKR
jgi:hypothetical protein